tara:strand:+ start:47 stop:1237 length:1191 start_codon:yes stop_codon:yes gene_type:complete
MFPVICFGQIRINEIDGQALVIINGDSNKFIIDTGAEMTFMPQKKINELINNGIIKKNSISKEPKIFRQADNTQIIAYKVYIKSISFAGKSFPGYIHFYKNAPYLLGNNILNRLQLSYSNGDYYDMSYLANKDLRKYKGSTKEIEIKKNGTYYREFKLINETIEKRKKNRGLESFYSDSISSMIDFRDMTVYKTVNINGVIWMAENLSYGNVNEPGIWVYENDISNKSKYGYLYSYNVAKYVCPTGWHLPTTNELKKTFLDNEPKKPDKLIPLSKEYDEYYENLTKYFRTFKNEDYNWYYRDYIRKPDGSTDWDNYSTKKEEITDRDYNAGLNLVPSGRLDFNDFFNDTGGFSTFYAWTNGRYTAFAVTNRLYDLFNCNDTDEYNWGMAVRCIMDE